MQWFNYSEANLNAQLAVKKQGHLNNEDGATVNVNENGVLKGLATDSKINNKVGAVINVKGILADGVYNAGLINVIENGM